MFVRNILLLVCILGNLSAQSLVLNIRENGKICTQWINSQIDLISYQPNRECINDVSPEYKNGNTQARLCCQSMPLTTPAACGKQLYTPLGQRIIGGSVVKRHSWPWQVFIRGWNNICGGVLIDERHVLTAAHCIQSAQGYTVIAGSHDRNFAYYTEQTISSEKIYKHEQYDTEVHRNDIAIIYLSKAVQVTDEVNFICLPGPEADIGEKVYIAGWGQTSVNGNTSPLLQQTDLTVMNCDPAWHPSMYDTKKQICAGALRSMPAGGDSGGPLMYQYNGQWYLNGIASFVPQNYDASVPSVFTRVSYYLPWIRAKMALAKRR